MPQVYSRGLIIGVVPRTGLDLEEGLTARGDRQAALHREAGDLRTERFGREVFVRAVVEISNFCRENCHYCGMRRDNHTLSRSRAQLDELIQLLVHNRPRSITDVNIQAGEDPIAIREIAVPLIQVLRRETALGISVCLGTLSEPVYKSLQEAGAAIYIIKFETSNPALYERYEAPGRLDERVDHIRALSAAGWAVSSGFISGIPGQSLADLASDCRFAQELPLNGCSVSPFIPGEDTPLANAPHADIETTLNCMAMLRRIRPDWVIPAVSALNLVNGEDGYRRGLRAGANLVTMNLTPRRLREDYIIYRRRRFIMDEERVLSAIAAEGLAPSKLGLAEYYKMQRDSRAIAGRNGSHAPV